MATEHDMKTSELVRPVWAQNVRTALEFLDARQPPTGWSFLKAWQDRMQMDDRQTVDFRSYKNWWDEVDLEVRALIWMLRWGHQWRRYEDEAEAHRELWAHASYIKDRYLKWVEDGSIPYTPQSGDIIKDGKRSPASVFERLAATLEWTFGTLDRRFEERPTPGSPEDATGADQVPSEGVRGDPEDAQDEQGDQGAQDFPF